MKKIVIIIGIFIVSIISIILILFNKNNTKSCNVDIKDFINTYNNQIDKINNYYPFSIFDSFKDKISKDDIKKNKCSIIIDNNKYIYKDNNFINKKDNSTLDNIYSSAINNVSKELFIYIKNNYLLKDEEYIKLINSLEEYSLYGDEYQPGDMDFAIVVGEHSTDGNTTLKKVYKYFIFDFNKKEFTYSKTLS